MRSALRSVVQLILLLGMSAAVVVGQVGDNPSASGLLGQTDFTTRATGLSASEFNGPNGVAVDPTTGKLFVADRGNHRVLRFASEQAMQTGGAAEAVFGQDDFVSRVTGVAANRMNNPIGIHVGADGRLWVADFTNNRVLRFDDASNKASGASADGVLGQPDFTTSAGVISAEGMRGPVSIFAEANGRLWVNEFNSHRITRFENAASKANGAPADGVLGQADFTTGTSGLSATNMTAPNGHFVDNEGRLWVSDSGNRRITRFDDAASKANGSPADGVLGQPDMTTNTANLTRSGITTLRFVWGDSQGRIYVVQENSHRITIYENAASKPDGADADYIWGQPDYTTGTALNPPTASSFNTPRAIYLDEARDHMWVADWANHRVLRFDLSPELPIADYIIIDNPSASTLLGQADFTTRATGLSASEFNGPNGVAVDPTTGKLFVADRGNHRVLRFASEQAMQTGGAAEAVFGQDDFVSRVTGVAANRMNNPIGIHVGADGRLWVADFTNNRVLRFDDASNKASGASADGVLGQPDFTTSAGVISAEGMRGPVSIFAEANGRLWVNEFNSHRITRFENAASKANGAPADGVLGQADFTTGTSGLSATNMAAPNGHFVDNEGRLWVSDSGNRRITRFDDAASKANGSPADGVLGQPDMTTNTANLTRSGITTLRFVWGDSQGRIYVVQENSHRITIYDNAASKPDGADADYIWGQPDYTTGTALNPPTASSFNTPRAIYLDEARDHMWVADWANHRVLRFDMMRAETRLLTLLSPVGGEEYGFGTTRTIRWTAANVDEVLIEYSSDDGSTWTEVATVAAAAGQYTWVVPEPATDQARIRITDTSDPTLWSVSAAAFSVTPPNETVTLRSPNGFQNWPAGGNRKILFSTMDVASVDLSYSLDDGDTWLEIVSDLAASVGEFVWTLPEVDSQTARVRITKTGDASILDISQNAFAITTEPFGHPQDFVFFADSPTSGFYDPSWSFANAPSNVERTNTKLPVTTDFSYFGNYSVRLNWLSAEGGDWGAAIASQGWIGRDLTTKDTLAMRLFTETTLSSENLPVIYLEDLSNAKSAKLRLADLTGDLVANTWNHVQIPISVFEANSGAADLTRIKTIFFGQDIADNVQRTVYLDDVRAVGGDIISGETNRVIVVLGSSTAAGAGATTADSSWVGRFRSAVRAEDPDAYVVNLAIGGYSSYDVMPTDFIPPSGRPSPKPNNNITYALSYKPHAIVINLPSNDAAQGFTIAEQLANFRTLVAAAEEQGVPVWVTTTQPRNFADDARRENLMAVKDSILAVYGTRAIDVWSELAEPNGMLKPEYNSGDGIHITNAGHRHIFEQVMEAGIWAYITTIDRGDLGLPIQFELDQNYPNPFNPTTTIQFSLPSFTDHVSLAVFDMLGRKVADLVNSSMNAGSHAVRFDGSSLANGVYIYRLDAGGQTTVRTMVLLK
jgi:sugar lactone lactonase YvrE/lysophospholipase L1-like esterase